VTGSETCPTGAYGEIPDAFRHATAGLVAIKIMYRPLVAQGI
jgi:hypothetical protein